MTREEISVDTTRSLASRSASSSMAKRTVVEGCRLPDDHSLTRNERSWIEILRALVGDADPPPTLRAVQHLRLGLMGR